MATCSTSDLIQEGKSFLPLSDHQLQAVMVKLLCNILTARDSMATCDPNQLVEDAKCFSCLSVKQLLAVQAQLLCDISQGETCIVCLDGQGSPTDPAPCDCSLAYNTEGQFWFWNSESQQWTSLFS